MAGGPVLGVFCLGMFFPWANSRAALCAQIISTLSTFFIGFGAIFNKVTPIPLPIGNSTTCNYSTSASVVIVGDDYGLVRIGNDQRFVRVSFYSTDVD
jgi:hypothetical protein